MSGRDVGAALDLDGFGGWKLVGLPLVMSFIDWFEVTIELVGDAIYEV